MTVFRPHQFVIGDGKQIYLDGNSLGRLPLRTRDALAELISVGWGHGLVESWEQWLHLPREIGDHLGRVCLGAAPGTTVLADNVTVNLFKLTTAALEARPARNRILTHDGNFPTDRYVLDAIAERHGARLVAVPPTELAEAVDGDTALVAVSHVDFTTGYCHDLEELSDAAHAAGALLLADLSHSVGVMPVDLPGDGVDLATACTYKYLNSGPGAPAFLYVAPELTAANPIAGWFAHRRQFDMPIEFEAAPGAARFQTGTPDVAGLVAIGHGVALVAEAGLDRIRAASSELTEQLVRLADHRLAALGFEVASPRDPKRRGGHVALRHPEARGVSVALRRAGVVGDFRPPDVLRLAPVPLYVDAAMVDEAVDRLVEVVGSGLHMAVDAGSRLVT